MCNTTAELDLSRERGGQITGAIRVRWRFDQDFPGGEKPENSREKDRVGARESG